MFFLAFSSMKPANPLSVIKLSGEALKAGQLQEIQSRNVERILKGAGTVAMG
jgi:hypothetical protein